jgi:hypothetical protein
MMHRVALFFVFVVFAHTQQHCKYHVVNIQRKIANKLDINYYTTNIVVCNNYALLNFLTRRNKCSDI